MCRKREQKIQFLSQKEIRAKIDAECLAAERYVEAIDEALRENPEELWKLQAMINTDIQEIFDSYQR